MPSIWIMNGLHCRSVGPAQPGRRRRHVFGALAVVLGHNGRIAWGATNVNPDTCDLFWRPSTRPIRRGTCSATCSGALRRSPRDHQDRRWDDGRARRPFDPPRRRPQRRRRSAQGRSAARAALDDHRGGRPALETFLKVDLTTSFEGVSGRVRRLRLTEPELRLRGRGWQHRLRPAGSASDPRQRDG